MEEITGTVLLSHYNEKNQVRGFHNEVGSVTEIGVEKAGELFPSPENKASNLRETKLIARIDSVKPSVLKIISGFITVRGAPYTILSTTRVQGSISIYLGEYKGYWDPKVKDE